MGPVEAPKGEHVRWSALVGPAGRITPPPPVVIGDSLLVFSLIGVEVLQASDGKRRWLGRLLPDIGLKRDDAAPLLRDGILYLQDGGTVSAYEESTGRSVWTHRAMGAHLRYSPWPVTAGGLVQTNDGNSVVAYDPASGAQRWKRDFTGVRTRLTAGEDRVFAGLFREIVALDGATGRNRWSFEPEFFGADHLALSKNVLFALGGSSIVALDASTGKRKWQAELPEGGPGTGTGFQIHDDVLYLVDKDASVHALDCATGRRLWRAEIAGSVDQRSNFTENPFRPPSALGLLYLNDATDNLIALDTANGRIRWRRPIPFTTPSERPVIAGRGVHIASAGGVLSFALDTGAPLRSLELDGIHSLAPGDDVLYVRTEQHVAAISLP